MDISAMEFAEHMKCTLSDPFRNLDSVRKNCGYEKNNLPPLLGRRDARLISFVEILQKETADFPAFERISVYRQWRNRLAEIISDTSLVIAAMSSKDGIMREQRLLNFLCFIQESVLSAEAVAVSEMRFLEGDYAIGNFIPDENIGKLRKKMAVSKHTEVSILQGIEDIINLCRDSIRRHREYARQSASSHNLARYQSAFAEYTNEKKNSARQK